MPKTKISEYSATANSNTDVASINIDEGCAPSGINNAIRAIMGHLKDFQSGTSNDPFTVGSSGSLTLSYGTANGVAYLNGSKVVTTGSALVFDGTNLGVGVTPSAWLSSISALQVKDAAVYSTTNATYISTNEFTNSSAANIYKNTGFATLYAQRSGQHQFFNAPSGTAGNPISFTQAMTLDSSGNLGIGTTSPSQPLHVSKNQNASTWAYVSNTTAGTGSAAGFLFASDVVTGAIQAVSSLNTGLGNNNSLWIRTTGAYPITLGTNSTVQMTLDSSGNLGLGVTPSAWTNLKVLESGYSSSFGGNIASSVTYVVSNGIFNGGWLYKTAGSASYYRVDGSTGSHVWYNAPSGTAGNAISFTQAMTLDASGNLLVGTTSTGGRVVLGVVDTGTAIVYKWPTSGSVGGTAAYFEVNAANVGNINCSTTATTYATSSDYRLKEDIQPMTGALAKVQALKPCTYKWKADGSDGEGFIAHELAEVVPQCVTGEKDAVDADGNPKYQGIDTSFLVATLTAALQEAHGLIKDLQARVAVLEAK